MPNNDGGVQSAVDSAKKALSSARTFTKSATGGKDPSLFAPKAAAPVVKATPAAPAPNVGDELKVKSDNVQQYADASKPMASFKEGTNYVPKTGNYTLHEGEKVTPAKDNMAKSALSKAGKNVAKKKKKKGAVHITPTDNDGFVVDHDSDPESEKSMTTAKGGSAKHAIANVQDLVNHIQQHFGQGAADADKDDAAARDAQAQAAASPAPQAAAPAPAGPAGGAPQEA